MNNKSSRVSIVAISGDEAFIFKNATDLARHVGIDIVTARICRTTKLEVNGWVIMPGRMVKGVKRGKGF